MADSSEILAGLDRDQSIAVTAPAGPLCILAGAGTGKTRAITHRIAHRVRSGQVRGQHVLAVTFTARAAAEMRERLGKLGAEGVQARTFHAAALRQVRYFAPRLFSGRAMPELLDSKARLVGLAATKAGLKTDREVSRDLASEIEWAKASLIEPDDYAAAAAKALREPPFDAALVAKVYAHYERAKRAQGVIDFEDMIRAAIWAVEEHPDVAEQVRAQYRHFVVDEYQDVNPMQQRLLEAWLGGREDVTVVGDASQTIYSFTGASASYLVDFQRRHPRATVVRLTRDYRSTPQVVGLANAVISRARGELSRLRLELVGQRPPGPEPTVRTFADEPEEAAAVAARCAELIAAGTPAREIAVLFRVNAQSEVYQEALAEAGVPYVVHGTERFFERTEVREAMIALRSYRGEDEGGLVPTVHAALARTGWMPDSAPAGGAQRERWEAVSALVSLAEGMVGGDAATLDEFNTELQRRAAVQHVPTVEGVTLSSLHSAKGLEWDAVFLVGLTEGTLPVIHARTPDAVEEERRLLYVGVTRARHTLWLSHAAARTPGGRPRRQSRFVPTSTPPSGAGQSGNGGPGYPRRPLDKAAIAGKARRVMAVSCRVCGTGLVNGADRKLGRCSTCPSDLDEDLLARLQDWRARLAAIQKVPAFVIFTDVTLAAIAERRPGRREELAAIAGIGPRKLMLYGDDVVALVGGTSVDALARDSD
ncbi:ATP-dependent DNA helicase UvrD2 [Dactylosporangium matsuzakiense]|uniref:DNA 3'-5' helicase n=1 Tax=Dactylosporangium matsuzakiense TaxID=53360 RepID=A0A9W6KFR8_9ACTN|nr:ATP-dependent DNA helicase UvrD2 [Dactylosporangium matsuzakiense]GLL00037.1 DNA helicase [Dactylosporangium matsuzakiense]